MSRMSVSDGMYKEEPRHTGEGREDWILRSRQVLSENLMHL